MADSGSLPVEDAPTGCYMNVDPANRMVADALEADWNARLRQLDTLQQEHDRQRKSDQGTRRRSANGAFGL